MQYFGLTLELKDDPDVIAKYKEYHAHPWLEPLEGAKEVGVIDMKIFLLGTRMFMFMTAVDGFEPERDFTRYMEQNPKAREWDDLMRTFQEKVPEAKDGEWWANMELVFDMQLYI